MHVERLRSTLKITVFKVDTRNEILLFLYFLFCLQNSKKILDVIILLKNVLGTLGGLLSCQKQFQGEYEEIVDKKFILIANVGEGQN